MTFLVTASRLPLEAIASKSIQLQALFDTAAANWEFGYTFDCIPATATNGRLTVRVRASFGGCANDGLNLQFDAGASTFAWSARIAFLQSLTGGPNAWNVGDTTTITLDLAALPLTSGGTIDLLPIISAQGFLDIHVQDDTAVDFLELSFCDSPAVGTSCLGPNCPTCPTMALTAVNTPLTCSANFGAGSRFSLDITGAPSGGLAIFVPNVGPCTAGLPLFCGTIYPNPVGWLTVPVSLAGVGTCGGTYSLALGMPCGTQGVPLCAQAAVACPGGGLGLTNAIDFVIE